MHRDLTSTKADSFDIPSASALDAIELPRHRWYFFKEAFSPEIVDYAIEHSRIPPEGLILDPFCGSGTVPLQASLQGYRGHGIEVNPFLAFVARAKLSSASNTAFDKALDLACLGAERGARSPLEGFSTFSKRRDAERWLFNTRVLRAFEGARLAIEHTRGTASSLVRLCLIEAAMATCNATKDGKCLRYRRDWESLGLGSQDFIEALNARASIVRSDLHSEYTPKGDSKITTADARSTELPEAFDLCVTSPPYLNSFDYTDVYRPELFLGQFVGTMSQLSQLRLRTLRSHVQARWPMPKVHEYGSLYAESLRLVTERKDRLWDKRIPAMITAYFEDMEIVLRSLRRRAKPEASAWIVVSTSAYAGVEIPVDLIIADIAGACGWYLRDLNVLRHLGRVSGQQWNELSSKKASKRPHMRESVVVLNRERPHRKHVSTKHPTRPY